MASQNGPKETKYPKRNFEIKLANVGNIDNSLSFFDLTRAIGDGRTSGNIIGWALTRDALQSVTDDSGTETTNRGSSESPTNWNKLRIGDSKGHVRLFINETEVADHTTTPRDFPFYLNFFGDTEAPGATTTGLGIIRCWTEDIAR